MRGTKLIVGVLACVLSISGASVSEEKTRGITPPPPPPPPH